MHYLYIEKKKLFTFHKLPLTIGKRRSKTNANYFKFC